jgi:hypothetical protein
MLISSNGMSSGFVVGGPGGGDGGPRNPSERIFWINKNIPKTKRPIVYCDFHLR